VDEALRELSERRIEVLSLHGAKRARHIAIAGVTACHSQRTSRIKNGAELGVAQFDRRRAAGPRGQTPT
jgi:hypothetical protein